MMEPLCARALSYEKGIRLAVALGLSFTLGLAPALAQISDDSANIQPFTQPDAALTPQTASADERGVAQNVSGDALQPDADSEAELRAAAPPLAPQRSFARQESANQQYPDATNGQLSHDQVPNERFANEQVVHDQVSKESSANERTANEQVARNQVSNESSANERSANEQVARDQVSNERLLHDQTGTAEQAGQTVGFEPQERRYPTTNAQVPADRAGNSAAAGLRGFEPQSNSLNAMTPALDASSTGAVSQKTSRLFGWTKKFGRGEPVPPVAPQAQREQLPPPMETVSAPTYVPVNPGLSQQYGQYDQLRGPLTGNARQTGLNGSAQQDGLNQFGSQQGQYGYAPPKKHFLSGVRNMLSSGVSTGTGMLSSGASMLGGVGRSLGTTGLSSGMMAAQLTSGGGGLGGGIGLLSGIGKKSKKSGGTALGGIASGIVGGGTTTPAAPLTGAVGHHLFGIGAHNFGGGAHNLGGALHNFGGAAHGIGGGAKAIGGGAKAIGGGAKAIGGGAHNFGGAAHAIGGAAHNFGGAAHAIGGAAHIGGSVGHAFGGGLHGLH